MRLGHWIDQRGPQKIYTLIGVLISCNIVNATAHIECVSSKNCTCYVTGSDYKSQCPINKPDITTTYSPSTGVYLQCGHKISWKSSDLPLIKTGDVVTVYFKACPPPDDTYLNLMNKLGIKSTKELKIDSSNLQNLTDYFKTLNNLKSLSLHGNHIEHIDDDAFINLLELQTLDLSYNNLTSLSDKVFTTLNQLTNLNLESNRLESIGSSLFIELYNLREINLKNNRISYIHKDAFHVMFELKILNLAGNYLDFKGRTPFVYNLKLEKVNVSHNNISIFTNEWTFNKIYLKELDFSYNQVANIQFMEFLAVSPALKINLSYNQIAEIDFENIDVLASELKICNKCAKNKVALLLNGNPVVCDCLLEGFVKYLNRDVDPLIIQRLTVQADDLHCSSPEHFISFPVTKLKANKLTCDSEQILDDSECPEKCRCVRSLLHQEIIINCTNRHLTRVPNITFPGYIGSNKISVYLGQNLLKEGPTADMGYDNVTVLNLSSNDIHEVNWVPPKIQFFDLDNNHITHFSDDVISMLNASPLLISISLRSNPWDYSPVGNLTYVLFLEWPEVEENEEAWMPVVTSSSNSLCYGPENYLMLAVWVLWLISSSNLVIFVLKIKLF